MSRRSDAVGHTPKGTFTLGRRALAALVLAGGLASCDPPAASSDVAEAGPSASAASTASASTAPRAPVLSPMTEAPAGSEPRAPYAASGVEGGGALVVWAVPDARRPGTSLVVAQAFDRSGATLGAPRVVRSQRGTVRAVAAASGSAGEALVVWTSDLNGATVTASAQRVTLEGRYVGGPFSLGVFRLNPNLAEMTELAAAAARGSAAPSASASASAPRPTAAARTSASATAGAGAAAVDDPFGLPIELAPAGDAYVALMRGVQAACSEGPSCRAVRGVLIETGNHPSGLGGFEGVSLRGPLFVLGTSTSAHDWVGVLSDDRGLRHNERAPVALDHLGAGVHVVALWRDGDDAYALARGPGPLLQRVPLRDGAGAPSRVTGTVAACEAGGLVVRLGGVAQGGTVSASAPGAVSLLRTALLGSVPAALAWTGEALVGADGASLVRARCRGALLSPFEPVPAARSTGPGADAGG